MIKWNKVPFLRLILPFILGIVSAMWLKINLPVPLYIFFLIFYLTSLTLIFTNTCLKRNNIWIAGFLLNIFLFISGYELSITANKVKCNPYYYGNNLSDSDLYTIRIVEPISVKKNSTKVIVEVETSNVKGLWRPTIGRGIIYFEKDSFSNNLNYGDQLLINSKLCEVKPPQNPNEFDYRNYLANKYIYYQSYVKNAQWKKVNEFEGNFIYNIASRLRKHFLKIFEDNNMTSREYAVISAILLGQTDHIDSELFREYQGSGAVHVLVVAGLHVGIILLMLNFLLGFMEKFRHGIYIKTILILFIIWFYALMTGLSPPIMRAALMITFVSLGKNNLRSFNSLNLLIFSSFCYLVYNPNLLADVGFQLSYMAVAGILILQKPIVSIWSPQNKLIDKFWHLTALSIAAQLFTLPLTLLYFHQFPNLFLITNLFVFFFVAAIIFMGIAVLITSWFSTISIFLTKILVWLIWCLNSSIHFIETFPGAVSRHISFNIINSLLIYLLITFILFYILMKIKRMIYPVICIILLIIVYTTFTSFQKLNQKRLIVYDIRKTSVFNIINGNNCLIVADSSFYVDKDKFNFHFENNYTQMGVDNFSKKAINNINKKGHLLNPFNDNFIQFKNTRIVLINKPMAYNYSGKKIMTDYLIISHNAKVNIKELLKMFDVRMIIFDSSNYLAQTIKWTKECDSLNINCFNVLNKGAYEVNL